MIIMVKVMQLEVKDDAHTQLSAMASDIGLSVEKMCRHILEEFTFQGKVYAGGWSEGPGKRIIIDFPKYSSRVLKIKENELGGK